MIRALLAALLLACACAPAQAGERVLGFDSNIVIQADGSLDVTETIRVRAEGVNIRRGIYRDFPTRYTDRYGNRVVVDFEPLGVLRDGRPEPWFTERKANGVRVNTGNDDFLQVPKDYTYTIHYRSTRQLGFFADHDELYWNVTGLGWDFPIDAVTATVALPAPVPSSALKLEAYTGPSGAKGTDYQARSDQPGVATFRGTRSFNPGEGLTLVVGFPKGLIPEPTRAMRLRWFLRDNRGVLVALGGLLLLVGFYLWRWLQVGRDPPAGVIFPRYEAPEAFGPGELRMLRRMGDDRLCFTADVVDMAVRGYLLINEDQGLHAWSLVRTPGTSLELLTPSQRVLAASLFKEGDRIELKNSEATRVQAALSAHGGELKNRLEPKYFHSNGGSLLAGILFSLAVGGLAFFVSGGAGIPALIAVGVVALAMHIVFGRLLKAPTSEGRKLLDEIEGLRMYLGVAERDELQAMPAPGPVPHMDAKRYETLLPYAIALDVAEAWTRRFTLAVGAATAAQSSPTWYHGTSGRMGLANIGSSLGSALNGQISSAATPPGSSSGGGGGGGSGGGGGGGGGGGR